MKILMLFSDEAEGRQISTKLGNAYKRTICRRLEECLREPTRPDLILVDPSGLGLPSIEVIRAIQEHPVLREAPILASVGMALRGEVADLIKSGVRDIILSPSPPGLIKQKVEKYRTASDQSGIEGADDAPEGKMVIEEKRRRQVEKEISNLPAFPTIINEMLSLIQSDKSSASDFEKFAERDQVITGRMLKMANSSFYNQQRQITLIRDAVVVLGYDTVKSVVYAASTNDIFKRNLPQYGLRADGIWKHSLSVGLISKLLAPEFGLDDRAAEELFICGLLHDIGKLVLGNVLTAQDMMKDHQLSIESILLSEKKYCGLDHCDVGRLIADKWNLPEMIADALAHHHSPQKADSSHRAKVAVVCLANCFGNRLKFGHLGKIKLIHTLEGGARQILSIGDRDIETLFKQIDGRRPEIEKFLKL